MENNDCLEHVPGTVEASCYVSFKQNLSAFIFISSSDTKIASSKKNCTALKIYACPLIFEDPKAMKFYVYKNNYKTL